MSGRLEQLGRQLRRLRTIAADPHAHPAALTLSRATKLAIDLALEHADRETPREAIDQLVVAGMIDMGLADRLNRWIETDSAGVYEQLDAQPTNHRLINDRAMPVARDLDRFLRCIEHQTALHDADASFDPIAKDPTLEKSRPSSKSSVTVSGRILELAERAGQATVTLDDRILPIRLPGDRLIETFPILAAPRSKPEVHYEPSGTTRIQWVPERFSLELAPDLASVRVVVEVG